MKKKRTEEGGQLQWRERYVAVIKACTEFFSKCREFVESYKCLYFVVATSAVTLLLGCLISVANLITLGAMILFVFCVAWCVADLKARFLTLVMYLMQFTFWLSRPVIDGLRGNQWWYFSNDSISKAFAAIYISQLALFVGTKYAGRTRGYVNKCFCNRISPHSFEVSKIAEWCLVGGMVITGAVNYYVEFSTYRVMKIMDYASIYTSVTPTYPKVISVLSMLFPFAVVANLSLLPHKKNSLVILGLYIISAVPSLLLGSRNEFVVRVLFAVIYFVLRGTVLPRGEQWISKLFVAVVGISALALVVFMGAYNYIRGGASVLETSIWEVFVDFFQKQGTTFDTICQGFEFEEEINALPGPRCYTLGDIIDYFRFSSVGQWISGIAAPKNGNSVDIVMRSNSMAHRLSYVVLERHKYLAGHGRGTAYIIENYYDGGFLLIALYNLCLGTFLASIPALLRKNRFILVYFCFTALTRLYLLPRYSASSFVSFVVTPHFWLIPAGVLFVNHFSKIWGKRQ